MLANNIMNTRANITVALFDADGVLTLPEEFFAQVYARSHGLHPDRFDKFFHEQFPAARVGKADLKDLITQNKDVWQWNDEPEKLLTQWFQAEDVRNQELIEYIQKVRSKGILCYIATNQEKYRGEYIKNVMFANQFDGFFISAEMGMEKPEPSFFTSILDTLQGSNPTLTADNIAFFDNSQSHVHAAASLGIGSYLYTNIDDVKTILKV